MSRLLIAAIVAQAILLLILLSNEFGSVEAASNIDKNENTVQFHSGTLPKLFDWEKYKKMFHKSYKDFKEEMIRKKLHLISSLKTFMHNILYRWSKISYFLAMTQFADWTINEIDSMYKFDGSHPEIDGSEVEINDTVVLPDLNEEELSSDMQYIIANKEPGFKLLKTELELRENDVERTDLLENSSAELRHIDPKEELKSENNIPVDDELELPATPKLNERIIFKSVDLNENDSTDGIPIQNRPDNFLTSQWARLSNIIFNRPTSPKSDDDDDGVGDDTDADDKDILNPSLYNFLSKVPKIITDFVLPDQTLVDRYTDYRTSGCLSMPRRQYECGSCYAFATIAYLEWAHCKDTGVLMAFSEQFMVDCGVYSRLNQCKGGFLEDLGDFVSKYGVELRKNYPYTAKAGKCPFEKADKLVNIGYAKPTIKKWTTVQPNKWHTILNDYGPMIAGLKVPSDFQNYGGQVHSGHNCDHKRGHAMLLVGHGVENGLPYWIFKNSHGFYWGEYGYFRLSKFAKSNCFMYAIFSDVTFSNNPTVTKAKTLHSAADKYKLFKDNMI